MLAPTLVNVIRRFGDGAWRQLFGDATVPDAAAGGEPAALSLTGVLMRAFGLTVSGDQLWLQVAVLGVCAVVAVLAVVSLALPFVLRASRMMWVVVIAGAAAALLSVRVATGAGDDGAAAGTALPGVVMCLLGLMSCACMVAGMAVKRFEPAVRPGGPAGPYASDRSWAGAAGRGLGRGGLRMVGVWPDAA